MMRQIAERSIVQRYGKTKQYGMTLLEISVVLLVLIALAGLAIPHIGGTGRMAMCQATDATMKAVRDAIMGSASGAGFYGDLLGHYPRDKAIPTDYNLSYLFDRDDGIDNDGDGIGINQNGVFDPDDEWQEYNPKTAVGWRGPYIMNGALVPAGLDGSFSAVFDAVTTPSGTVHTDIAADTGAQVLDAWGRPVILQIPLDSNNAYQPNFDYARLVSAGPGNGIGPGEAQIDTQIAYDGSAGLPDANDRADDRVLYLRYPDPLAGGNTPCDRI